MVTVANTLVYLFTSASHIFVGGDATVQPFTAEETITQSLKESSILKMLGKGGSESSAPSMSAKGVGKSQKTHDLPARGTQALPQKEPTPTFTSGRAPSSPRSKLFADQENQPPQASTKPPRRVNQSDISLSQGQRHSPSTLSSESSGGQPPLHISFPSGGVSTKGAQLRHMLSPEELAEFTHIANQSRGGIIPQSDADFKENTSENFEHLVYPAAQSKKTASFMPKPVQSTATAPSSSNVPPAPPAPPQVFGQPKLTQITASAPTSSNVPPAPPVPPKVFGQPKPTQSTATAPTSSNVPPAPPVPPKVFGQPNPTQSTATAPTSSNVPPAPPAPPQVFGQPKPTQTTASAPTSSNVSPVPPVPSQVFGQPKPTQTTASTPTSSTVPAVQPQRQQLNQEITTGAHLKKVEESKKETIVTKPIIPAVTLKDASKRVLADPLPQPPQKELSLEERLQKAKEELVRLENYLNAAESSQNLSHRVSGHSLRLDIEQTKREIEYVEEQIKKEQEWKKQQEEKRNQGLESNSDLKPEDPAAAAKDPNASGPSVAPPPPAKLSFSASRSASKKFSYEEHLESIQKGFELRKTREKEEETKEEKEAREIQTGTSVFSSAAKAIDKFLETQTIVTPSEPSSDDDEESDWDSEDEEYELAEQKRQQLELEKAQEEKQKLEALKKEEEALKLEAAKKKEEEQLKFEAAKKEEEKLKLEAAKKKEEEPRKVKLARSRLETYQLLYETTSNRLRRLNFRYAQVDEKDRESLDKEIRTEEKTLEKTKNDIQKQEEILEVLLKQPSQNLDDDNTRSTAKSFSAPRSSTKKEFKDARLDSMKFEEMLKEKSSNLRTPTTSSSNLHLLPSGKKDKDDDNTR